jgi:hypothetical protein
VKCHDEHNHKPQEKTTKDIINNIGKIPKEQYTFSDSHAAVVVPPKYKKEAQELFLDRYGQSAINALYEKAPNKAAQEDAFVRTFKRKPTTNADKFAIIEGDFKGVGEVGKAKGGLASRR